METEMEKYGMPGYGLLCPAERLQMALGIKSKVCWLQRNGFCDTSGATVEWGEVDRPQWRRLKSKGWSRTVEIAFKWLFLKNLKINCLWKKKKKKSSADRWYAGCERKSRPLPPLVLVWASPSHALARLVVHRRACWCWSNAPELKRGQVFYFTSDSQKVGRENEQSGPRQADNAYVEKSTVHEEPVQRPSRWRAYF